MSEPFDRGLRHGPVAMILKNKIGGDDCGVSRSSEVGVDLANSAGQHGNAIA